LNRVIVTIVLIVLGAVVATVFGSSDPRVSGSSFDGGSIGGVLQAAGLLFFAFAGYARIATLGEEVRDPARTIPRAIPIALGITLAVYAIVTVAVGLQLGGDGLATSSAPLADAVRAAGHPGIEPVIRAGAAVAALGSLLSLILGVSRTTLAMARDGHLPHSLAAVHPRFAVPHRAELVVGAVVAVLAAFADVRGAIGFSAFAVLVYYAIANASALTLGRKLIPAAGLAGCILLAVLLPIGSVLVGAGVVLIGALGYWLRRQYSS
jgi:APA family basic amino acid/polyamine antiporter